MTLTPRKTDKVVAPVTEAGRDLVASVDMLPDITPENKLAIRLKVCQIETQAARFMLDRQHEMAVEDADA